MIGLGLIVSGTYEREVVVVKDWNDLDTRGKKGELNGII